MPLPEELLNKLKSTEWKERHQGVTDLEQLIDSNPQALGPHIVKVQTLRISRLHTKVIYFIFVGI